MIGNELSFEFEYRFVDQNNCSFSNLCGKKGNDDVRIGCADALDRRRDDRRADRHDAQSTHKNAHVTFNWIFLGIRRGRRCGRGRGSGRRTIGNANKRRINVRQLHRRIEGRSISTVISIRKTKNAQKRAYLDDASSNEAKASYSKKTGKAVCRKALVTCLIPT